MFNTSHTILTHTHKHHRLEDLSPPLPHHRSTNTQDPPLRSPAMHRQVQVELQSWQPTTGCAPPGSPMHWPIWPPPPIANLATTDHQPIPLHPQTHQSSCRRPPSTPISLFPSICQSFFLWSRRYQTHMPISPLSDPHTHLASFRPTHRSVVLYLSLSLNLSLPLPLPLSRSMLIFEKDWNFFVMFYCWFGLYIQISYYDICLDAEKMCFLDNFQKHNQTP